MQEILTFTNNPSDERQFASLIPDTFQNEVYS